ncbi:MAG: DUF3575 domain-containing protein [Gemmatimonadota bacterium]
MLHLRSLLASIAVCGILCSVGPQLVDAQVHRTQVSANPFLLLAEWYNLELEHSVTKASSLALSASRLDVSDDRYSSLSLEYRYYPSGEALRGFHFGPRLGLFVVDDTTDDDAAGGFGFEVGYNWLLGERDNVLIGLGVGVNRLFGEDRADGGLLPSVRLLNIGWAF